MIEIYNSDFEITYKEDDSPLTCADRAADEIIVNLIKEAFPEHAILSEESADDLSRLENPYCWIIDPLDGTKEFIHRTDEFTVNIALVYNHKPVVGVVYVPVTDELYYSILNEGSYYEYKGEIAKIQVSGRTEALRILSSKYHRSNAFLDMVEHNASRIKVVEGVGSSLKGCLIAKGDAEGYYRYGLTSEWDTAAVQLIVEEAGGIFMQMDDTEMVYNREDTLNRKGFYIVNDHVNILK
ncbi:MAG: 3'(2'),5'-bisphosphate nucleotidase CysQ [Clostridia bacterium]|nr:3'(2'),5'-bisphosphate nucleotidase CysQ [Clostridia bacterium]